MRILVVEDERVMARSLQRGLTAEGYQVEVASDGQEALGRAISEPFDAILLDLMLPKLSGNAVVEKLRSNGVGVPVLMLTAKQGEEDQTNALDLGADDFLSKPFSYPVLLARLRALIRRGGVSPAGTVVEFGDLYVDQKEHRCWRGGEEVALTRRELALLAYLVQKQGEGASKAEILEQVWEAGESGDANLVEVYVGYLRRKLDRPGQPSHIETIRSLGYRLTRGL